MGQLNTINSSWLPIAVTSRVGTMSINVSTASSALYVLGWGDGYAEQLAPGPVSHSYVPAGLKTLTIRDEIKSITLLALNGCSLTESLLNNVTNISGSINIYDNPDLIKLVLPVTQNLISAVNAFNCNLTGTVDFTTMPNIGGTLRFDGQINKQLRSFIFPPHTVSNTADFTLFRAENVGLQGALDLSNLVKLGGDVRFATNGSLTSIIFPDSPVNYTVLFLQQCNITGTLDISKVRATGTLWVYSNPNLTSILFNPNITYAGDFYAYSCKLTGTLDLSAVTVNWTNMRVWGNAPLTNINWGLNAKVNGVFYAYSCALNITFPLGTTIKGTDIRIQTNSMSVTNVDASITNLYNNRDTQNNTVAKALQIHGTNGVPTGVYQVPSGFVLGGGGASDGVTQPADGTPASPKEMVYVLVNQRNADGTLKYKWTITTN